MKQEPYDFIVSLPVTLLEADLIQKLRKVTFGEVVVFKQRGEPFRIEIRESKVLSKEEGANVKDAVILPNKFIEEDNGQQDEQDDGTNA